VHTSYSHDGFCTVAQAVKKAKARGLSGIAIADHNTIAGHAEISKFSGKNFLIIPGIEVSSRDGHILGLGINELIPRNLSAAETVDKIREQGGIAVAAHPFSPTRKTGVMYKVKFDAIEIFNPQAYFLSNPLAKKYAEQNKMPMTAGSDAHFPDEVGLAYVGVTCEPELDDVLKAIARGEAVIFGHMLPIPKYIWNSIYKLVHMH
jgi:predicted metal-dependent phosphoesterase TrpH